MLFSNGEDVNFPDISVGNNTINETSVTKFLGIHLDEKVNFVNHITEMSMKVAKLIGLLYKLNRFLPGTILESYILHLFIHTYHMVQRLGMEHIKIIPLKPSFSRRKPYVQ